jgi:hypothetical protein
MMNLEFVLLLDIISRFQNRIARRSLSAAEHEKLRSIVMPFPLPKGGIIVDLWALCSTVPYESEVYETMRKKLNVEIVSRYRRRFASGRISQAHKDRVHSLLFMSQGKGFCGEINIVDLCDKILKNLRDH